LTDSGNSIVSYGKITFHVKHKEKVGSSENRLTKSENEIVDYVNSAI
jgi:hypothetical protein